MTLAALSVLLAVHAAAAPAQDVALVTADGWRIAAAYRPARPGGTVLVLAHGVGSAKGEWTAFAERLAARGVGSLAVDLRGHGASARAPLGEEGYAAFDASGEWPRAVADLEAAAAWLRARGVARIAYGGASIGANLAALAAAKDPAAPFALLLSPGADYRGVRLAARPGLPVLAAASEPDGYAFATVRALAARVKSVKALLAPSGHGVQMFEEPGFLDATVDWVARRSAGKKDSR